MNPQQINPQRSYPVPTSQVSDNYKCWKLLTQSVNAMCSSYHHHHHHTHKSEEHYLFRLTGTGKKAPNKRKGEKISNFQDWFDAQWPTVCVCVCAYSVCACVHTCVCVCGVSVCMCLRKCIVHRSFTSTLPFSYQPGACNVYVAHNTVKTVAGAAYDRLFSTDNAAINSS